jgi:hypothetical protein
VGKIRNIIQSVGNREIIKTTPDLVVYLEGFPYLKNFYLTTDPNKPVLVNHNDYVTAFNASYDTDQAVPTCTISLVVPAHLRYLFQAPGGNNLIKSMMQVQVYAKGYYFASDGNTLFHRVFKGYTSHITHTDDGKTLLINIQCEGILGFFKYMQIDLAPALQSSSPQQATALQSTLANMSPYQQLAFTLLYASDTDGFFTNAIGRNSTAIQNTIYFDAVEKHFVTKWQIILAEISQDTHIYGLQNKDVQDVITFLQSIVAVSTEHGTKGWSFAAAQSHFYTKIKESDQAADVQNTAKIRRFMSDMGIGTIQLINGRVISRLEFMRTIAHNINYEFYQDIDGQIILKPPLYNLDVTNLGSNAQPLASGSSAATADNPPITHANNPFIAHLSEITNESETEDQNAVQATRFVVQGVIDTGQQFVHISPTILGTGEFMDLPKLAQFGLREEPARTVPWLADGEPGACFAQAACELARANLLFRTYSFTIPLRPEIKLGFPMFIPHRDMYGYVKSINIQFQIGGTATMSITLDALRKRAMFPQAQPDGSTIFVAQPNLVLKWVQQQDKASSTVNTGVGVARTELSFIPNAGEFAIPDSSDSPANQIGDPTTVPISPTRPPVTADQQALISFQKQALGSYFAISSDTTTASWQVQPDLAHVWSAKDPTSAATFSRSVSGNADFNFYKELINTIPYTDEKGYEVVTPFPWGRWLDINTAVHEVTRTGYVFQPTTQTSTFSDATGTNTFLYAGMTTPINPGDAASKVAAANAKAASSAGSTSSSTGNTPAAAPGAIPSDLSSQPPDITVFELDYSNFNPGGADSIIQVAQPSNSFDVTLLQEAVKVQKVNMFLTGTPPQPDLTLAAQAQAVSNRGLAVGQTPVAPGLIITGL